MFPQLSTRRQVLAIPTSQTRQTQQGFAALLAKVTDLQGFVDLLGSAPTRLFNAAYAQPDAPAFFQKIVDKFREAALPETDDRASFENLMRVLPIFNDPTHPPNPTDPAGGTLEIFDAAPDVEPAFVDIFDKWLRVWPVNSLPLPNGFILWLSGVKMGATTSDKDLARKREEALREIYSKWLAPAPASGPDVIPVHGYTDFIVLVQLVPGEFWYWQDTLEAPRLRQDYVDKRTQVWRKIYSAWRRIRTPGTGLAELPFIQMWTIANGKPWPKLPDGLSEFDKFRLSRRGRIWT
jgi:hypothetical protein